MTTMDEIAKAMTGRQLKALVATKNRGTGRAKEYAQAKYNLFVTGQREATHPLGRFTVERKKQAVARALARKPEKPRVLP